MTRSQRAPVEQPFVASQAGGQRLAFGLLVIGLCTPSVACKSPQRTAGVLAEPNTVDADETRGPQDGAGADASSYDAFHADVSDRVQSAAGWLDSLLADERELAELDDSSMTVRLDTLWEEREGAVFKARVKARVALPRSKKRLHLVVSGYEDDDETGDFEVPNDPTSYEEPQPDLGLQLGLKQTESNNARLEGGVRLNGIEPNPYAGVRIRHSKSFETWALRFRERARYYLEEGFESRTSLDLERVVGDRSLFRATSTGNWFQEENSWFLGQSFTLFQVASEKSVISYTWSNSFVSEPEYIWSEIRARVGLNHRVLGDRIALELAPQISWRHATDYEPILGVFLRLEFLFGGAADL